MRKLASCIVQRYQGNMLRKLADWKDTKAEMDEQIIEFQKLHDQQVQQHEADIARRKQNAANADERAMYEDRLYNMAINSGKFDPKTPKETVLAKLEEERYNKRTKREEKEAAAKQEAAVNAWKRKQMLGYGLWGGTGAVLGGAIGGAIGSNYKKTLLGTLLGGGLGAGAGLGGKYFFDKWYYKRHPEEDDPRLVQRLYRADMPDRLH